MMQLAGNPCYPVLHVQKADFLSTTIKPITLTSTALIAVSIDDIIGKPITVKVETETYLINQPNIYEPH